MNLRRAGDYDVLILVSLIWFLGKFVRYAFPPLFETLQATYGASNAAVGTAFTGFMAVYALMQFPSGVVADRVGPVRVIVVGAVVAGLGAVAVVVDAPFAALVVAMLVIGGGTGLHKTVSVRLLARVYPARTGRMLGVHDTLGALSGVAAPAAVVLFLSAPPALAALLAPLPGADWRGLFLATGLVALALAAAFALRIPGRLPATSADSGAGDDADDGDANRDGDPNRDGDADRDADRDPNRDGDDGSEVGEADGDAPAEPGARDYLALFRDPRFSAFVLVTVGFAFAHNGLVAFLPLYLSEEAGLTTATANLVYSVVFAVTFVQLVTGELSDRIGRYPVMAGTLGLAAVALVALLLAPDAGGGTVAFGLIVGAFGIGSHGFQPVRSAYLMEILPDWLAGGGLGVVRTLLMGGGALAPGIVGIVADVSGFRAGFALLAASMGVAAIGVTGLWLTER